MNQVQSLEFLKQAQKQVPDAVERNKIVACAVAVALAKTQDIPTAPVEDAGSHYVNNISPRLRMQLSAFNEGVVFDIRYSNEVVRALWMLRYFACHGTKVQMYKPENSFAENFTGASQTIPPDVASVLDKNQMAIGLLATTVTAIFAEMAAAGAV